MSTRMAGLRRPVIVVVLACVVLTSCAGPPARKPGALYRSYQAPLAQVYEAARRGFQHLELIVSEVSADRRYLEGGRDGELADGGEMVHVWLEDIGAGSTGVWIDTDKPGWVWHEAFVDWSPKLLDRIGREIKRSAGG